jgi:DNA-binding CsgD family transcriptional regulator
MSSFAVPSYEIPFSQASDDAFQLVEKWIRSDPPIPLDIDQFQDCVYVKNAARQILHSNLAYKSFFDNSNLVIGTVGEAYLDSATLTVSAKSDDLLVSGGNRVEFDYVATRPDGRLYNVKTQKRWLAPNRRSLSILGISRILAELDSPPIASQGLAAMARKFESLDAEDQSLCRLVAGGRSQREIADLLGCTTRTIENRRNRIMNELDIAKPIDIVKLMVRMAEHRLIPADF